MMNQLELSLETRLPKYGEDEHHKRYEKAFALDMVGEELLYATQGLGFEALTVYEQPKNVLREVKRLQLQDDYSLYITHYATGRGGKQDVRVGVLPLGVGAPVFADLNQEIWEAIINGKSNQDIYMMIEEKQ